MAHPDSLTPGSASGSGARRRSRLKSLARGAAGAAWTMSAPLRWGAGVAVRASEAAVSEVAARALTRPAAAPDPPVGAGPGQETAPGMLDRALSPLRPVIDAVVRLALEGLDLTRVVLEQVDLDAVVAAVDLDSAVARVDLDSAVARVDLDAAVARVDLDAIVDRVDVKRILDRLDLDAIVARVDIERILDRLDLDAIVARVDIVRIIDRLDIDAIVERVDLDRIINRLDLDAIVARVDIEGIVAGLDLDAIVAQVDPDAIVSRVDFDLAISHIDLIGIATAVVDGIDLAGIIRDSTGSLASEAVHGVRVQGQQADDAIGQFVGRMLGRRRQLDGAPIVPRPGEPPAVNGRASLNGHHDPRLDPRPPADRNRTP
ncbi:hypothetical protein [Nakamurella multipartita]|uniref:Uncharacterized protein n=1 Tax=Nakamurella multipartita (strain ATCC 700099 / DSM 44233 / CIP 104796 / JCM 9543 / NBRC 105858 / Y-104) TaxID=479431 RepID=C8XC65_NAKMY|nr:hypothetical protein [Nakamurella multipartita]ACV81459.1 hypothetical protein Namu_5192 [Nakamurella multipartita DSM 44233]